MELVRVTLFFLACFISLGLIACGDKQLTEPTKNSMSHDHSAHKHDDTDLLAINPKAKMPEIGLSVEQDSVTGWNIRIDASNFQFTPEKLGQAPTLAAEGHAHIYVDDYKIARIYGPWYHLKPLSPGPHTILVSLNANDHSSLTYNGIALNATMQIIQQ
jgi:hypothetical protein